jgi:hypothetical protein
VLGARELEYGFFRGIPFYFIIFIFKNLIDASREAQFCEGREREGGEERQKWRIRGGGRT